MTFPPYVVSDFTLNFVQVCNIDKNEHTK